MNDNMNANNDLKKSFKYKLLYFDERGKADLIKLIFAVTGVEYEEVKMKHNEWSLYKAWIPFEQLPALVINNEYAISHLNTICRYLAKEFQLNGVNEYEIVMCDMIVEQLKECNDQAVNILNENDVLKRMDVYNKFLSDILPKTLNGYEKILQCNQNNKFIIGSQLTWADLAIILAWDWLDESCKQLINLYPFVKQHSLFIRNLPKVSEWYRKQRPLNIQKNV